MPATRRKSTPVECDICSKVICRRGDLPRHMQTHATNKEDLKLLCPISGCGHRTLQKSNLQTHIARHTGELKNCPDCTFANADPSQITEHRKEVHGHMPKPRRYFGRTASRRSAVAPYPSVRYLTPEASRPADRARCTPRPATPDSQTSSRSSRSTPSPTSIHQPSPPISPLPTSTRNPSYYLVSYVPKPITVTDPNPTFDFSSFSQTRSSSPPP